MKHGASSAPEKQFGNSRIVILVGYAVKVSWRMSLPVSNFEIVDQQLTAQLARIEDMVREENGVLELSELAIAKLQTTTKPSGAG